MGYNFICRYKHVTEGFISQKKHTRHEDLKQVFVHFILNALIFEMTSLERNSTFRHCLCQQSDLIHTREPGYVNLASSKDAILI